MRATVCLPTYDERANLEPMLRALQPVLRDGDRVLVIDDNSPDGTGELADRLAVELPFVSVLHRPLKEGLGPAYLAGFRRALDDGAELVVEMDCDFSHDPADVPRLIEAVEDGADIAIGSRYVTGGGVGNWGLVRRIISTGGSLYAALFLQIGRQGPDRGLQVHPALGARGDRPRPITSTRICLPDRDDVPCQARGFLRRRAADHIRRPDDGDVEDEPPDRARGDLAGPAPQVRRPMRCRVTDETFDAEVLGADRPVVVDFTAPWCGPCKAIEPALDELPQRAAGRPTSSSSTSTRTREPPTGSECFRCRR